MVHFLFSGLPPAHPLVKDQGFDPVFVNKSLTADAAEVVKAGYNLRGKSHYLTDNTRGPLPSNIFRN